MSQVLITGATGFVGRYLAESLLAKGFSLNLLVRNTESPELVALLARWQKEYSINNVTLTNFDLSEADLALPSNIKLSDYEHVYHLAAIYDLSCDETTLISANVEGTERLLNKLDEGGFKGCFHFVSSIAVAGNYQGRFDEAMFDEGQSHPHPYHLSKFLSEKIVREYRHKQAFNIRIYRPSAVVGHSKTGYIDKINGPYYLCLLISALKQWMPNKLPFVLPQTKVVLDIVPVDYVVNSLVHLSMLADNDIPNGQYCFHLSDPASPNLSDLFSSMLNAAEGPSIGLSFPLDKLAKFLRMKRFSVVKDLQAVKLLINQLLEAVGLPNTIFDALMPDLRFEAKDTLNILSKASITPPSLNSYIEVLWSFYAKNLDPYKNRTLLAEQAFKRKRVVITGGSSGIGFASAKLAYQFGAEVILVARDEHKLKQCEDEIRLLKTNGGKVLSYSCDLSVDEQCDALIDYLLSNFQSIDVLFSNAGRSIRRSLSKSGGRFHDLERTMRLNYFGSARLILGILPLMAKQGSGHIVHSSSMGTLSATPRFGPYMASKIALDTLMDSMAAEYAHKNIHFSSIKFPLVKTAMVAPTKAFKAAKLTSPEKAAMMFIDAVIDKNRVKLSGAGKLLNLVSTVSPSLMTQLYSYGYQIWPDAPDDFPEMRLDRMLIKYLIPHSPL